MKIETPETRKAKADRVQRVKRTAVQFAIVAFLAVYPIFLTISDWGALLAALPTLGFVALGAIVTDIHNRIKPAG